MMDTVLCLGLNEGNLAGLAKRGGERFALDCFRRFLDMYGDVVLGIPHSGEPAPSLATPFGHVRFLLPTSVIYRRFSRAPCRV
jgi:hypothetical protein